MEKLELNFIGVDSWSRPVFETEDGRMFKDTNCGEGQLALCTVSGGFDEEPDTPIQHIEKYQDVEFTVRGNEDEPTREEKSRYQLLGRLQSDCEYYLGYGNRSKTRLWAGNEEEQIKEMKKLYNSFSADKKPQWLTWSDIIRYETLMCGE